MHLASSSEEEEPLPFSLRSGAPPETPARAPSWPAGAFCWQAERCRIFEGRETTRKKTGVEREKEKERVESFQASFLRKLAQQNSGVEQNSGKKFNSTAKPPHVRLVSKKKKKFFAKKSSKPVVLTSHFFPGKRKTLTTPPPSSPFRPLLPPSSPSSDNKQSSW